MEIGAQSARIVYALDMAEIPTFQEPDTVDRDHNIREARFQFAPGVAAAAVSPNTAAQVARRTSRAGSPGVLGTVADSAASKRLTPPVVLFLVLAAIFRGAVHAVGPGHGKTVVAAYLVGSKGTAKHAVLRGTTVTATLTASTYLLGLVTLFASHVIVPERLYPALTLTSGLLVIALGLSLLISPLRAAGRWPALRIVRLPRCCEPAPTSGPARRRGCGADRRVGRARHPGYAGWRDGRQRRPEYRERGGYSTHRRRRVARRPGGAPLMDATLRRWLSAIEERYDAGTQRLLLERGVGPGSHCWDVGAGSGSIALWLADRVGPSGQVLATDIDTRFLTTRSHQQLRIRRHDVTRDALPAGSFDLIHVRLVLEAFPDAAAVLQRLVGALRVGGWLLVEENDNVSAVPDPSSGVNIVLYQKVRRAMEAFVAARRGDRGTGSYGRQLVGRLRSVGLVDLGAEGRVFIAQGGDPSMELGRLLIEQLGDGLIATGAVTAAELEACLALHEDPRLLVMTPILMAAWGRRPA